jgi:NAD(P)-dependent dehydrogenase (short-subunit alcohol dehydrogenase family)
VTITIDLGGRTALVTGAGAGIGRGIATWLGAAGAFVAVVDIRAERAVEAARSITAAGGEAMAITADLRDDAAHDRVVEAVVDRRGGLDVAVNNVGMLPAGRRPQPFVHSRGDAWRDIVDQNLTVAALGARAQAEAMLGGAPGDRCILFVSSGETTRPSPTNAVYAAAKAALNHLVTSLAVEWGPHGIRCLAIAPGTTMTEQVAAAFDDEHYRAIVASTPLRRAVDVDELGRLAVFLASDLARCITGQFVLADAGAFLSRTRPQLPGGPDDH